MDPLKAAAALNRAAKRLMDRGNEGAALSCFMKALDFSDGSAQYDENVPAALHSNTAFLLSALRRKYEAARHFELAAAIYEKNGDAQGHGEQLMNLGSIFRDIGTLPDALEYYERSLAVFAGAGLDAGVADQHANIGHILWRMGERESSMEHFRRALALYRQVGDGERAELVERNLAVLSAGL